MTKQILKSVTIPFLIILFRDIRLFITPRLWAEEGTIYFREAFFGGFKSIFEPSLGYYSFFPRTFSYIASLFPIEMAPLIMTIFSLSIWLIPHILIGLSKNEYLLSYRNKTICSLVLILTAPSDEIFINSINLHFLTPWILILIGIDNFQKVSKTQTVIYLILIWLSILNGPVAMFVLPIYAYFILSQKKIKFLFISMLPVLIQLFCIINYDSKNSIYDRFDFSLKEFGQVFYYRTLIYPYLGSFSVPHSLFNLIGMQKILNFQNTIFIFYLCFILYSIYKKNKFTSSLLLGSLIVSILTYASALNPKYPGLLIGGDRYFYLPNTMISIGHLFFILQENRIMRFTASFSLLLILLCLYSSGTEYITKSPYCSDCANWKTEVQQNFKTSKKIEIWPKGWSIDFN
ncbi:hypothetical protein [Leptospira stimsonii]|uniref:DUF2029 domain-containing protein n=1 Tax=Leptospira stimsonii TaxID=2202203 RepID=A0A8B3CUI0_9LEPT|nr:hypothetical protein [Leptospira stimsonii]RHX88345.1 hypothetical protein DLM78_05215 [Leptospira stimsonii]